MAFLLVLATSAAAQPRAEGSGPACRWPANASKVECDMDLGHMSQAGSADECMALCCGRLDCASWQYSAPGCGASSGCGCWLGHKNVGGHPTGCRPNPAWVGGTRVPPNNYPPRPPAPAPPSTIPAEDSMVWPQPQSQQMGTRSGYVAPHPAFAFAHGAGSAAAASASLAAAMTRSAGIVFQHQPVSPTCRLHLPVASAERACASARACGRPATPCPPCPAVPAVDPPHCSTPLRGDLLRLPGRWWWWGRG